MCGIAGLWDTGGAPDLIGRAKAMTDALAHRGPDGEGHWVDEAHGLALGHRRLAILDLSPAGSQPMGSASGRFWITYNGEVYNFQDLRADLEAHGATFRGHSDTEVMLAAFEAWGVEATLPRLVGMFAFAVWDRQTARLTLVRDRFGKKPLFHSRLGDTFAFASEPKALARLGDLGPVDRVALAGHVAHLYVPGPRDIRRGVQAVPPSHLVEVVGGRPGPPRPYWDAIEVAARSRQQPMPPGPATDEALDRLLRLAVAQRMVADVPLGALLSGGVDSSLVVALMQAQSARPVRTFTIGFAEASFDEADHARAVASHLGTDHKELRLRPEEAMQVVARLPAIYDGPFADVSQVPTLLVAGLARRHVTVALSGDGGDEVFGGYNRYVDGLRAWRAASWMPAPLGRLTGRALGAVRPRAWDRLQATLGAALPPALRQPNLGDKVQRGARVLGQPDAVAVHEALVTAGRDGSTLTGAPTPVSRRTLPPGLAPEEQLMLMDTVTYLPDDILVKVDRASMSHSLEVRAPLLDHRVFEFAWRLPLPERIDGRQGKVILRRLLDRYVPRELMQRPKMGFGVPLADWLRGPLRDWADGLLAERRLRAEGFFDAALVRRRWTEHTEGRRNWHDLLWSILMFEAWLDLHPELATPAPPQPARA